MDDTRSASSGRPCDSRTYWQTGSGVEESGDTAQTFEQQALALGSQMLPVGMQHRGVVWPFMTTQTWWESQQSSLVLHATAAPAQHLPLPHVWGAQQDWLKHWVPKGRQHS